MAKSTKAEHIQRIGTVENMILDGASKSDIRRYSSDVAKWGVGWRMIDKYYVAATKRIEKSVDARRETQVAKAIRRFERLYKKALNAGDHRGAAQIQKNLDELLGLNAPSKLEMTGKDGGPIRTVAAVELTDDQLARIAAGQQPNE